jgi:O-antigen/teichoic acid export membrane protein
MDELKSKALRGGLAKVCVQSINFLVRLSFLIILSRLLNPADFGLIAMVTAVTGLYGLFTSAGLADAAIQTIDISHRQVSALFWCNLLVGVLLSLICLTTAPIIAAFYQEPRLFWVTIVMAAGFVITAAGTQHNAILQRQLRYFSLALIEGFSEVLGVVAGIAMAVSGYGYWALVGTPIITQTTSTACLWLTTAWIPERPRRTTGLHSLLYFGGTITLNGLIVYVAYNFEKILLGRFWGADALGIYGRAYQLVNIPTQNFNSAVGGVAFSALSRLQGDHARLKKYFLNGYALVLALTTPTTIFCMIFADDLVAVILGPKWMSAALILRLLAPTILIFGMINPLGWLLFAVGLQGRSLRIAIVIAPLVITAYIIGLPYGPSGVALAYSGAMTLWLVPHVIWCVHNTIISPLDILNAVKRPLLSGIIAACFVLGLEHSWSQLPSAILRLGLGGSVMVLVYLCMLLFVFGQKTFYRNLLREMRGNPSKGTDWGTAG